MGQWYLVVPESTDNLISNPSFERNATGWSNSGSNTIARSTTQVAFGAQSLACTYQDNTTLATFADLTLTAVGHTITAYVYLSSNWDGGAVRLAVGSFTSVTTDVATTSTTTTGEWVRLEMSITPDAGDLTGDIEIETASAPTAGRIVYVDAVQVEAKDSYSTTYCDGDQPGCSWGATRHNSTSSRAAYASGGRVRNMEDDLSLPTEMMQGVGMPPVQNSFAPLALGNGGTYENSRYAMREMIINSSIVGSSLSNLHSLRQTLVKAFNAVSGLVGKRPQERIMRYTGASTNKEISVVYDAGLEFNRQDGYTDETSLRFIAPDPMFYALTEGNASLDAEDSLTVRLIAGREDGIWNDLGPPNASGTYTQGNAVLAHGDYVYLGGDFDNFDNVAAADAIARYSLADNTWSAMGSGGGANLVYGLTADESGNIYFVGDVLNMGGVAAADYIGMWDGSSWNALGTPSSSATISQIWQAAYYDGNLMIVGDFTDFAGVSNADYVAYWDGSSWNAMPALSNEHTAIAVDQAGNFYVADWDTSVATIRYATAGAASWTTLGSVSDTLNGTVRSMAFSPSGVLHVGGDFTTAGGTTVNYIAKYSGGWQPLGGTLTNVGVDNSVFAIGFDNDGFLWMGRDVGGDGKNLKRYAGGVFEIPAVEPPARVTGITFNGDDIYFASDSAASAEVAGDTDISYTGTAPTNPVITLNRSGGTGATLYFIQNITTGAKLTFNYDFADGETWTIDTRRGQRSIVNDDGTSKMNELKSGNLGDFYLAPALGEASSRTNTILVYFDAAGGATLEATIHWRNAYLSAD